MASCPASRDTPLPQVNSDVGLASRDLVARCNVRNRVRKQVPPLDPPNRTVGVSPPSTRRGPMVGLIGETMTLRGEGTGDAVQPVRVACPYCGERSVLWVDCSAGPQQYIEDCQVCCRPMNIHATTNEHGRAVVDARHEDA